MEPVEEGVVRADTENDLVAARRALWSKHVARLVAVDDVVLVVANRGDGDARAERT